MTVASCTGAIGDVEPGLLSLELQPAAAVKLSLLKYTVSHERGFVRSGPVAIGGDQTTFAFDVGDLPPAFGYVVSAFAQGTINKVGSSTVCTGQASFEIRTAQSTAVSMRLQCDGVARTGTEHAGMVNTCPSVGVLSASPAQAPVGHDVQLKAEVAADVDGPLPLSYEWSADSGTLGNPHATQTRFLCDRAGVFPVRLTVSDGDQACEDAPATVNVTCTDADCINATHCVGSARPNAANNRGPTSVSMGALAAAGTSSSTGGSPAPRAGAPASLPRDAGTPVTFDAGDPWAGWPELPNPGDPLPDDDMDREPRGRRDRAEAGSGGRWRGESGAGAPEPSAGGEAAPEPQGGTDGSEGGEREPDEPDDMDAGYAQYNHKMNAAPGTRAGAHSESVRSR